MNALHQRSPAVREGNRILVLGDSFTFGWLLEQSKGFVSLIEQELRAQLGDPNLQLLNAATGGWGAGSYLAYLEEFGETISPNAVLVFLNIDDIARSVRSKLYTLNEDGSLTSRSISTRTSWKRYIQALPGYQLLLQNSHLVQLLRRAAITRGYSRKSKRANSEGSMTPLPVTQTPQSTSTSAPLAQALFKRLKKWCNEQDIPLYVVFTGWFIDEQANEPGRDFFKEATEFFLSQGIPYLSLAEPLRAGMGGAPERYYIAGDGHPNEAGAKLIAELTAPWLVSQVKSTYSAESGRADVR